MSSIFPRSEESRRDEGRGALPPSAAGARGRDGAPQPAAPAADRGDGGALRPKSELGGRILWCIKIHSPRHLFCRGLGPTAPSRVPCAIRRLFPGIQALLRGVVPPRQSRRKTERRAARCEQDAWAHALPGKHAAQPARGGVGGCHAVLQSGRCRRRGWQWGGGVQLFPPEQERERGRSRRGKEGGRRGGRRGGAPWWDESTGGCTAVEGRPFC